MEEPNPPASTAGDPRLLLGPWDGAAETSVEELGHRSGYRHRPSFPRFAPGSPRLNTTLFFDAQAGFHGIWLQPFTPQLARIEKAVHAWRMEALTNMILDRLEDDE